MAEPIYITHSGGGVSGTAALGSAVSFTGTISAVRVLMPNGNLSGETQTFDIYKNGAAQSVGLLVPDGDNEHTVTGLSIAATDDDVFQFYITAPVASTMPVPPYHFTITLAETHVALTGAQTIAGVKTFSSDPIIPDEAYGVGWNGSLEPPTKNAVYDKIETLGGGGTVDTANSPNANEYARFTDADTIEGRTEAEFKADMNLEIGTDVQAWDAQLDTWATVTPSANGQSLVSAADYAAMKALLDLEIGTDVQAYDAFLDDIAALTDPGADRGLFWDDSAGEIKFFTFGSGLSMTDTTLTATATGGGAGTFNIDDGTAAIAGTFTFDDGDAAS